VFDEHNPILIVPRHMGMASIRRKPLTVAKQITSVMMQYSDKRDYRSTTLENLVSFIEFPT
jgi:hypothetical protein